MPTDANLRFFADYSKIICLPKLNPTQINTHLNGGVKLISLNLYLVCGMMTVKSLCFNIEDTYCLSNESNGTSKAKGLPRDKHLSKICFLIEYGGLSTI